MKKSYLNLLIDGVLFLLLSLITGIGFLLRLVLVPGYKQYEIYGRRVNVEFLGLDRHQWGSLHFWISLLFIILLAVHIVLHWKCIKTVFCQIVKNKVNRFIISVFVGVVILSLLLTPFFVISRVSDVSYKNKGRMEHRHRF